MVTEAVEAAFEISHAALDALSALGDGSFNESQRDLLRYIFQDAMPSPNKIDPNEVYFEKLVGMYKAILKFEKLSPKPTNGPLPADDVIIHCDYSRFMILKNSDGSKNKTHSYDQDSQTIVKWGYIKGSANFDSALVGFLCVPIAIISLLTMHKRRGLSPTHPKRQLHRSSCAH